MNDMNNDGVMSIERMSLKRRNGDSVKTPSRRQNSRPRKRRNQNNRLIFVVILFLVVIFSLLSTTFSSAKVILELETAAVSIDGIFSATRAPNQEGDITYLLEEVGPISFEYLITDVRKEPKYKKAGGKVTVYNTNISGEKLDLVNKTRFEASDGRIYRMVGSQTIPGGKILNGRFRPGEKVVSVMADEVGDKYNLERINAKFSIPGLARHKNFADSYAVLETKIIGGHDGIVLIPDEEALAKQMKKNRKEISEELKKNLDESIKSNKALKQIIFDGGIEIEFFDTEEVQQEDEVLIKEKGRLRAISFREIELASLLVGFIKNNEITSSLVGLDTSGLEISIEGYDSEELTEKSEISIRIDGEAIIKWGIDKFVLLENILNKDIDIAKETILKENDQIKSVENIEIFPFWKKSLPASKSKIEVFIKD